MNNIYILTTLVIMSVLPGCAINGTNVSKNGTVVIERIDSEKLYIPWAEAYEDGNKLTIKGVIKQHNPSLHSLKGHVDVMIMDSNDQILQETKTNEAYIPPNQINKKIKWVRFNVTVPMKSSKGMIVRLCPEII